MLALFASRDKWKLKERELEAPDELSHEREIKRVDRVAGEVVVRIPKEGGVRDHQCRQPCIPERGVVAQAGFRQDPTVEGDKQRLDWQIPVLAEASQSGTSEAP